MAQRENFDRTDITGVVVGGLLGVLIETDRDLSRLIGPVADYSGIVAVVLIAFLLVVALRRLLRHWTVDALNQRQTRRWDASKRNPYPGLLPYDGELSSVFFGRSKKVNELVDRIISGGRAEYRFIPVVGVSGSGKSSLVRAGVRQGLKAVPPWRVKVLTASGDDIFATVVALLRPDDEQEPLVDAVWAEATAALAATGAKDLPNPTTALRLLHPAGVRAVLTRWRPTLLTIDQLEDIGPEQRLAFLALLRAMLGHQRRFRVVATLRPDILGDFQQGQGSDMFDHQVVVAVMDQRNLREVIERVARSTRTEFDEELVDAIVADTGGGDALPMLCTLLHDLYETPKPNRRITMRDYEDAGKVEGVIKRTADRAVREIEEALGGDPASANRRIVRTLLRFVSVDGPNPSRRHVNLARLAPDEQEIVRVLIQNRLMVSPREGELQGRVGLVHDALLRQWTTLREAIDQYREPLRLAAQYEPIARQWAESDRATGWLIGDNQLDQAAPLVDFKDAVPVSDLVVEFLQASKVEDRRDDRRYSMLAASVAQEKKDNNPQEAMPLALASVAYEVTPEALAALYASLATGVRHTLRHPSPIRSVAFSPDGQQIVTACGDSVVRLWHRGGAPWNEVYDREPHELLGHEGNVEAVTVLPDGTIATGGTDGTVRLWRRDGSPAGRVTGLVGGVAGLAPITTSGHLVIGSRDGQVRVVTPAGTPVADLRGPGGTVRSVAVSIAAGVIGAGCDDGTVRLWRTDGTHLRDVHGVGTAESLAFLADGSGFVAVTDDGSAQVWDLAGSFVRRLSGNREDAQVVVVGSDGRVIIGSDAAALALSAREKDLGDFPGHAGLVTAVAVAGDDGRVATGAEDGTVRIWAPPEEIFHRLDGPTNKVYSVAFSLDGRVAAASGDGTVWIWKPTGEPEPELRVPQTPAGEVFSVDFSNEGRLAVACEDGVVRVWEPDGIWTELRGPGAPANWVAFGPHGQLAAAFGRRGHEDGAAYVWSEEGELLFDLGGGAAAPAIHSIAISSTGRIVTGSEDGKARLWSADGRLERELVGHTDDVWSVAFDPDGRIATGSADHTARLWTREGLHRRTLEQHEGTVWSVAFAPDGRLATASEDDSAAVWTPDGELLYQLEEHDSDVNAVAFGPDSRLATGSDDTLVMIWPDPMALDDLRELAGSCRLDPLTPEQREEAGLPAEDL